MNIKPLIYTPKSYKTLNFGTSERTLYKNQGTGREYQRQYYSIYEDYIAYQKGYNPNYNCVSIKNSNKTLFFRNDMYQSTDRHWRGFAKFLDAYFGESQKVNVYDFACSDGSEAYSLAISLIEEMGEYEAKKFFPIKAMDADPFIIKKASSGKIRCDEDDIKAINKNTNGKFDKYFKILSKSSTGYTLEARDILKNAVTFERKNIKDGMDEIEPSDSLILCRNMWPYLDRKTMRDTIFKMHKRLDDKSLIVIGDFDREFNCDLLPSFFRYAGLFEIHRNVLTNNKDKIETQKNNFDEKEFFENLLDFCEYSDD